MYRIEISPSAGRDLDKLKGRINRSDFEQLRESLNGLEQQPRPQGVRKIKGLEDAYRIRVGSFRIVYDIYDDVLLILILQVSRRNEATYRR
ncbi:MAG: type II toxin-antitoxin system RelE/ParE family toxin [Dehalococcoidales bacterium]|nr:type II toxin-antitoxin system RelE/ParE family toxin [Dehalococcoidales bacterium]